MPKQKRAMPIREMEKFIKDFHKDMANRLLERLDRVPLEWEGRHLKEWMAVSWADNARALSLSPNERKEVRNDILVNNL